MKNIILLSALLLAGFISQAHAADCVKYAAGYHAGRGLYQVVCDGKVVAEDVRETLADELVSNLPEKMEREEEEYAAKRDALIEEGRIAREREAIDAEKARVHPPISE